MAYIVHMTVLCAWGGGEGGTTPIPERSALPFMEMQELSAVYMVTTGMPNKQLSCGLRHPKLCNYRISCGAMELQSVHVYMVSPGEAKGICLILNIL